MVGLECWSVIGGLKDDLTLVLDMGNKQPRSLRLANRDLSFEQRTFEGEAGVLVQCPWRLESSNAIRACCYDPVTEDQKLRSVLDELQEHRVEAVWAEPPGWDLSVRFEGGFTLRVFCLDERKDGNWFLWGPEGTIEVGPRSQLHVQPTTEESSNKRWSIIDAHDDESEVKLWQARWRARRDSGPINDD